jgi:ABC-type branched-subunit amino acid transport system ATPase component/branched-subunit amino acid ABC-type transport system permease component
VNEFLKFAILGLGAGAIYGLAALGVVLVYRGSGVLNFAQGAMGMIGAFTFYNARADGRGPVVSWLLALGLAAALGALTHLAIMRPLRHAPDISRLIATLGILTVLLGVGESRWGTAARIVSKLLPTDAVTFWDDVTIGRDRLALLGIGVALTALLTVVYRFTRFGLATSAVAENQRASAAQGISPDRVATVNWALGSMLGTLAAILIVNITGLNVINLTLLVVPAFAAALVGGFRSFPLTLLGGLVIGVLESEVAWAQVQWDVVLTGWTRSVPFVVIVVVLVLRGRALPLRGEALEQPPEVGTGRVRPLVVVPLLVGAAVLIGAVLSTTLVEALTTTLAMGVVLLSLVVVTGYTGQLSLAQFSLAGMGAWIAARSIVNYDVGYELAFLFAVLGAIPIGVAVGLPALRARGVNLAVATLGLAAVLESLVLTNPDRTGGPRGTNIGAPTLFGIDFDTFAHPERYALLTLGVFTLCALAVANLRRGRAGRRLIAVRTNERAAAALGISVLRAKLYAFGMAAALAAVGGVLIAFRRPNVTFFPAFSVFESIFAIVYAVIGGIGFVVGAFLGAALAPNNFAVHVAGSTFDNARTVQIVLGIVLFGVLLIIPNGLASITPVLQRRARAAARWTATRPPRMPAPLPATTRVAVRPAALDIDGLTVRFGGVTALEGVSMRVEPGHVLGLIGPNGAGKTTLIDAVTGFSRPAAGTVTFDGTPINRWSVRRRAERGIARSFQGLELFESMTVRDNLRAASDRQDFLAYLTDLVWPGRSPLGPAAVAAIREFGLEPDLDRRPDELPFGRRRLVAIARAVASNPSVLLLDEPAAGLDPVQTAELGRLLHRLAHEWGIAVLLVEHDVSMVLDVCDSIVVLDFGKKIADGPPQQVRNDQVVIDAYLGAAADTAPAPVTRAVTVVGEPAPLLSARNLASGYGDVAVVHDLDLDVRPGEVVALLGPNGAGKTTTLLTLAGELPARGGHVVWDESTRRQSLERRARHGFGFVPEGRSVFMSLTVAENLRLGRGERRRAVELFPELEPLLRRRAGVCSGGEQQILALARALAAEPRVLLVDELSLGLAPRIVERLLDAVRAAADRGVGVLLVEQHARAALSIADRVCVLRRGRVVLDVTAAELAGDLSRVEAAYLSERVEAIAGGSVGGPAKA